jgi:hypothetical protein
MRFLGFSNHEMERGNKFRSDQRDQRSAARFREMGEAL